MTATIVLASGRMRSVARIAAVSLVILCCLGCGESTLIRTRPEGARLWMNDHYVGTTPVEYSCSRAKFSQPQRYRLPDQYGHDHGNGGHHLRQQFRQRH